VVEPYRRVVDLPVAEKRGFEATTYRPWSSKVGLISMVLEITSLLYDRSIDAF
jgi:hypothetical protein